MNRREESEIIFLKGILSPIVPQITCCFLFEVFKNFTTDATVQQILNTIHCSFYLYLLSSCFCFVFDFSLVYMFFEGKIYFQVYFLNFVILLNKHGALHRVTTHMVAKFGLFLYCKTFLFLGLPALLQQFSRCVPSNPGWWQSLRVQRGSEVKTTFIIIPILNLSFHFPFLDCSSELAEGT